MSVKNRSMGNSSVFISGLFNDEGFHAIEHLQPAWVGAVAGCQVEVDGLMQGEFCLFSEVFEGEGNDGYLGPFGWHVGIFWRKMVALFVGTCEREDQFFRRIDLFEDGIEPIFSTVE